MSQRSQSPVQTVHVSLWGHPGTGKSAVAGKLYGALREAGYEAFLVQEYAKELALQGELMWRDESGELREPEQFLLSAEQYRRQVKMDGLVEVVVTDAPLLQQLVFAPDHYAKELGHIINQLTIGWDNIDVLLTRDIRSDYSSRGRVKTAEEAVALAPHIKKILSKYRPEHLVLSVEGSVQHLLKLVIDKVQRYRTYHSH